MKGPTWLACLKKTEQDFWLFAAESSWTPGSDGFADPVWSALQQRVGPWGVMALFEYCRPDRVRKRREGQG